MGATDAAALDPFVRYQGYGMVEKFFSVFSFCALLLAHDDSKCGFLPTKKCPRWLLSDLIYAQNSFSARFFTCSLTDFSYSVVQRSWSDHG